MSDREEKGSSRLPPEVRRARPALRLRGSTPPAPEEGRERPGGQPGTLLSAAARVGTLRQAAP